MDESRFIMIYLVFVHMRGHVSHQNMHRVLFCVVPTKEELSDSKEKTLEDSKLAGRNADINVIRQLNSLASRV